VAWLAALGWLVSLGLAMALMIQRRRWSLPPDAVAEIRRKDGSVESLRRLRCAGAPEEITRPHGKGPATRYRKVRIVPARVIYVER
jgi:hypothetical protein